MGALSSGKEQRILFTGTLALAAVNRFRDILKSPICW